MVGAARKTAVGRWRVALRMPPGAVFVLLGGVASGRPHRPSPHTVRPELTARPGATAPMRSRYCPGPVGGSRAPTAMPRPRRASAHPVRSTPAHGRGRLRQTTPPVTAHRAARADCEARRDRSHEVAVRSGVGGRVPCPDSHTTTSPGVHPSASQYPDLMGGVASGRPHRLSPHTVRPELTARPGATAPMRSRYCPGTQLTVPGAPGSLPGGRSPFPQTA
jgi:hypothetical protein